MRRILHICLLLALLAPNPAGATGMGRSRGRGAAVSQQPPFTPQRIQSQFVAWWRPDRKVTLNGATISSWCSLVGTYCATQGTAAAQPTLSANDAYFNGRGVLHFDGGDTLGVALFDLSALHAVDVFTAMRADNTSAPYVTYSMNPGLGGAAGTFQGAINAPAADQAQDGHYGTFYSIGTTANNQAFTTTQLREASYDFTRSPHETLIYRNGVLQSADYTGYDGDNPSATVYRNDTLWLGAKNGTIAPYLGRQGEFIVYRGTASRRNASRIVGYQAVRFGVAGVTR